MAGCSKRVGGKCCGSGSCEHHAADSKSGRPQLSVFLTFDSESSPAFREEVRNFRRSLRGLCRFLGQSVPTGRPTSIELLDWRIGEIEKCDLLVVVLEEDLKKMLCMSIGAAIAFKKRVIVLAPQRNPAQGLDLDSHGDVVEYRDFSDIARLVREVLDAPLFVDSGSGGLGRPSEVQPKLFGTLPLAT